MSQSSKPDDVSRWGRKISKKFEPRKKYLIPILQMIQGEEGFLSPDAVKAVSRFLTIPEAKIYGVASFYAQFHFEPRGLNTLTVCRGTACHVRGSAKILQDAEKELGVEPGSTTEDMVFSLETVACFGACARAPVVVVNERVHAEQTSATCKKLISTIKSASAKPEKKEKPKSKKRPSKGRNTTGKSRTKGRAKQGRAAS